MSLLSELRGKMENAGVRVKCFLGLNLRKVSRQERGNLPKVSIGLYAHCVFRRLVESPFMFLKGGGRGCKGAAPICVQ